MVICGKRIIPGTAQTINTVRYLPMPLLQNWQDVTEVSALPTPSFPLGTADLPLLNKSGYHENTEVSGNVCQSG